MDPVIHISAYPTNVGVWREPKYIFIHLFVIEMQYAKYSLINHM